MKKILIVCPTQEYIETETFKSVFDLQVPQGFVTEFKFLKGEQIDQIRNLISEWAKRYDYLFSVDSDIVLPNDTLTKMLAADKDIISGLYIQRIPGTHTLEVYEDNDFGGVVNIPYEYIKDEGITEIAGCGMGCCLVRGEIFRNMEYPHFYYKSALDHRNTVSEDIYFCLKARELGYKIWADTSIKCEHIGSTKFVINNDIKKKSNFKNNLLTMAKQDSIPKLHSEYLTNLNINPRVIYDIGACVGHWTSKAKEKWPDARYFLIDASYSVEEIIRDRSQDYAIEVLSDTEKTVTFYDNEEHPAGNSYYKETTGAFTDKHKTIRTTKSLDNLITERKWPLPDLIKIDIQGAEIDVLKGASDSLVNCNDIILEAQHTNYNEGAPKLEEVIDYMKTIGYELVSSICKNDADGDYHFKKLPK